MTPSARSSLFRSQEERLMDAWVDNTDPYVRLDYRSSDHGGPQWQADRHVDDVQPEPGHRIMGRGAVGQ